MRQWCSVLGLDVQPMVRMDQLWGLADAWYANRLQADARRPAPEEIPGIFRGLGLEGEYWDLNAPRAT